MIKSTTSMAKLMQEEDKTKQRPDKMQKTMIYNPSETNNGSSESKQELKKCQLESWNAGK